MNTINLRVKELRDLHFNRNNVKMALEFNTSEANIRNYINGGVPKTDFVIAVCEKLEINFEWLLTGNGEVQKKTATNDKSKSDGSEKKDFQSLIKAIDYLVEENKRVALKNEDLESKIKQLTNNDI